MDTSKYKALYLQETYVHLSGIEAGLLLLEKEPSDSSAVDNLFRHYHSIKGMSASMGYEPVMKLAHRQEDLLDRIRSKKTGLSTEIISTLLQCLDGLKALVKKVDDDEPLDIDIEPFLEKLGSFIAQGAVEAKAPQQSAAVPDKPQAQSAPPQKASPELRISNVMKVEGRIFDELLTLVGDLFMALSSFREISSFVKTVEYKNTVHLLGKSVNALHTNILSARMLPIEDLTAGLPRVVRDICGKSGKSVELKIEGADLSLDRSMLESLASPIVHIIRNAVDHGIEPPMDRTRAGKLSVGTIRIRAHARKEKVVIEVSDDGRGIEVEKIKRKAVERGFSADKVAAMTDKEALMLVCIPGLSGADKVTDTSGRGVGMDVVKDAIEALGGTLEIDSMPGKGTRISLELPRTTAIIKALVVNVSGELFLLPISKVEKVIELPAGGMLGGAYDYNSTEVPVVRLSTVLGMEEKDNGGPSTLIIMEGRKKGEERKFVGLVVDDFGSEVDAYIKPLLPPISKVWGVSGITIMSDGRPVFLLDSQQIFGKALTLAGI